MLAELNSPSHYRKIFKGQWDYPAALTTWLEQSGYTELGSGIYSVVFGRPGDNIVIKVGHDRPENDPWVDYVEWIRTQAANPHFPRVGKIRWYADKRGRKFYLVPIERLKHSSEANMYAERLRALDKWVRNGAKVKDLDNFLKRWRSWNKDFLKAYVALVRRFPDATVDLHSGNIMARGSTMVLTDPLSFRDKR
jgi:hypothetical protein